MYILRRIMLLLPSEICFRKCPQIHNRARFRSYGPLSTTSLADPGCRPEPEEVVDTHKCGDCQKEFDSYENFLIHKLLVEQYKLTLETSVRIPSLRLPKFIKIKQISKPDCGADENSVSNPPVSTPTENDGKKSKESEEPAAPQDSSVETVNSPVVEVVVDSTNSEEVVSDDDVSVSSQPESLRIDESGAKETSPLSDSTSELGNDQNEEYYCKHCKRCYKNKVVLRVHKETVHSSTRPHVCATCQQGFKTKGSLVRHTRTHTGERPFSCSQCKRAFLDSGTLARHVHRVHRKRALKPFKQASDVKVVITRLETETQNVQTEQAKVS